MGLVNNGLIYTSPHTQAHLRSVLDSIRTLITNLITVSGEVTAVFSQTASTGQPIYITASGETALAENDNAAHAIVVGLVSVGAASTAAGKFVTSGQVTLDDWTAVTGSAVLTEGAVYFLGPTAGTLTVTPPTTTGTVVRCGVALSETVLSVQIQAGIFLA